MKKQEQREKGAFSVCWGSPGRGKLFGDIDDAWKFGDSLEEPFTVWDVADVPKRVYRETKPKNKATPTTHRQGKLF